MEGRQVLFFDNDDDIPVLRIRKAFHIEDHVPVRPRPPIHGDVHVLRHRVRDPPIFRSDPQEDAVDWLFRFEEISRYNGWSPIQKLNNFGMSLYGTTRRLYLSVVPRSILFDEICAKFIIAFKLPNYELDFETKLRSPYQSEKELAISY